MKLLEIALNKEVALAILNRAAIQWKGDHIYLVGDYPFVFAVKATIIVFVFFYIIRCERKAEVTRYDKMIVLRQLDMRAFQFLAGQLAHINTAVSIACNVYHNYHPALNPNSVQTFLRSIAELYRNPLL